MVDELIQEEKLNRFYGCAIQHPNQRQHSCLMMDKDDSWIYYREDVVKKLIWMQSWTINNNNNNIFISYIKYTNITPPANSKANRGRWCVDGLRFITMKVCAVLDLNLGQLWEMYVSPHVRESGFRNPGIFCLWNPESWALESSTRNPQSY